MLVYWVVGALVVVVLAGLAWLVWGPAEGRGEASGGGSSDPAEADDWTDIIGMPYDEAVSALRVKYRETFPILVLKDGNSDSIPTDKTLMYLWVDERGTVLGYAYDERVPAIKHAGIVRQYDRTA